jgi:hypothetical protein
MKPALKIGQISVMLCVSMYSRGSSDIITKRQQRACIVASLAADSPRKTERTERAKAHSDDGGLRHGQHMCNDRKRQWRERLCARDVFIRANQ